MGYLDLKSSRALIFSNISAGTGVALIRCRPEGIWCYAAFRIMVSKIFILFGSWMEAVFGTACPLSPYDICPSWISLS